MRMKLLTAGMCVGLCLGTSLALAKAPKAPTDTFYVYQDNGSRLNHYAPSGWMGDYGDLTFNPAWKENCADGLTCIKITYSGKGAQGANWAGIFWQNPANNWGDKAGGFDLSDYKRLTFWARGEKGDETIVEFGVGGITGEHADSDNIRIGPVHLTKDWKKYTIDLKDKNLKVIVGGFELCSNRDYNEKGYTMYLDEIRYEK